jgi:hypothetical protein
MIGTDHDEPRRGAVDAPSKLEPPKNGRSSSPFVRAGTIWFTKAARREKKCDGTAKLLGKRTNANPAFL